MTKISKAAQASDYIGVEPVAQHNGLAAAAEFAQPIALKGQPAARSRKTRRPNARVDNPAGSPAPATPKVPAGKLGTLVSMLHAPHGATIDAMGVATSWQAHSVRGAMSGSLKKKLGYDITSEKTDSGRVYRIVGHTAALDV